VTPIESDRTAQAPDGTLLTNFAFLQYRRGGHLGFI
jgi:hypothetical protein